MFLRLYNAVRPVRGLQGVLNNSSEVCTVSVSIGAFTPDTSNTLNASIFYNFLASQSMEERKLHTMKTSVIYMITPLWRCKLVRLVLEIFLPFVPHILLSRN